MTRVVQAGDKRYRQEDEVRTSWRLYDLVMIARSQERGRKAKGNFLELVNSTIDQINEDAAKKLAEFCPYDIGKTGGGWSYDPADPFCRVDAEKHKEMLDRQLASSGDDNTVTELLQQRATACADFWNYPLKILACPRRMLKEHQERDVVVDPCFGTIDFISLFNPPSLLWSNYLRMRVAEQDWVGGLLNLPMYRVKYEVRLDHQPQAPKYRLLDEEWNPRCSIHETSRIHGDPKDPRQDQAPRFVLYTFIHHPPNVRGSLEEALQDPSPDERNTVRRRFIQRIVNFFVDSNDCPSELKPLLEKEGDYPARKSLRGIISHPKL